MAPTGPEQEALTKHELILQYIQGLKIGVKISVRSIAKALEVSEGTAYRALKEAEKLGFVSTKERIGTVRIQKKQRSQLDQLTFGEVAAILDGDVLGGASGLDKTLQKVVIGAMKLDAMLAYIDADSLLIVGNRENAHRCALEEGAGVLITGGFDTSEAVKRLADERGLPIISSKHDTFTVASIINRAMYDRLIKRKIMLIEDIVTFGRAMEALRLGDTVESFERLQLATGHARFPVVDEWNRVIGIITAKDVAGSPKEQSVDRLMTRNPITIRPNLPVTSAAHTMASEGVDLLPIVDRQRKLLAVVTRQEVLAAMQFANKQPQSGETFDDLIWTGFSKITGEKAGEGWLYRGRVTPQMSGPLGTVSEGALMTLLMQGARRLIWEIGKRDHMIESVTTYFVRPIQIDSEIAIVPQLLEMSRKSAKLEIEIVDDMGIAAKAMLTAQMIDPY
ncbi:DRTGG domain-containing protein [Paenibacillus abyssi]|uniref:Thioesterase n=1 Tax=Paenibacillus abyssi TaxID=1340531 RepID=A0A917LID2_9BACL|nr:DRTGG domain-containing protein [Paenibacillus abyssi]GGG26502.1 thioesterase [Paenibacillus abyssi]